MEWLASRLGPSWVPCERQGAPERICSARISQMSDKTHPRALAGFFSPPAVRRMAERRLPPRTKRVLQDTGISQSLSMGATRGNMLDLMFGELEQRYRCEYVYKNVIARKLLLEKHSPSEAVLATELRCGGSKADVVILNGTSTVYEIKTELDNLDRLPNQLNDYRQMFDHIFVVTHHSLADEVLDTIDGGIGLISMHGPDLMTVTRESSSHAHQIDPGCVFDSLRKGEYMGIVEKHFGPMPPMPNTEHFVRYRELFTQLQPEVAHQEMVLAMRGRFLPTIDFSILMGLPNSLMAAAIESRLTQKQGQTLVDFLQGEYSRT